MARTSVLMKELDLRVGPAKITVNKINKNFCNCKTVSTNPA